jgi:hypothetical protein
LPDRLPNAVREYEDSRNFTDYQNTDRLINKSVPRFHRGMPGHDGDEPHGKIGKSRSGLTKASTNQARKRKAAPAVALRALTEDRRASARKAAELKHRSGLPFAAAGACCPGTRPPTCLLWRLRGPPGGDARRLAHEQFSTRRLAG